MSKTILLADDSVTIQKVVELTFMEEDYEVVGVSNGDDALSRLDVEPDLVIADVHMPGASGYDVCREVKKRLPGVPVVLLVGTFEPFDEARAKECGADSFLRKPFDSQDLLQLAEELTAKPRAAAEPPAARETAGPEVEATPAERPAPAPAAPAAEASGAADGLSDEAVEKIARRVVALLGDSVVREVAWEVVPDLAEVVIKDRLKELESQVE